MGVVPITKKSVPESGFGHQPKINAQSYRMARAWLTLAMLFLHQIREKIAI
jgi:hypothetical protein